MTGDRLITLTQVTHLTGLGRDHIYRLMRADLFPHTCRTGPASWSKDEVESWARRLGRRGS